MGPRRGVALARPLRHPIVSRPTRYFRQPLRMSQPHLAIVHGHGSALLRLFCPFPAARNVGCRSDFEDTLCCWSYPIRLSAVVDPRERAHTLDGRDQLADLRTL